MTKVHQPHFQRSVCSKRKTKKNSNPVPKPSDIRSRTHHVIASSHEKKNEKKQNPVIAFPEEPNDSLKEMRINAI